MVSLQRSALIIGLILAVHAIAIFSGWYDSNQWFDIPMHFAGGFAMAFLGLTLWEMTVQKVQFQKNVSESAKQFFYFLAILGFVATIGIAWEWYEFMFDTYASQVSLEIRPAQMGLSDTMGDFFFDLLGAAVAFVLFRRRE